MECYLLETIDVVCDLVSVWLTIHMILCILDRLDIELPLIMLDT
jgi:hypothetical protein